MAGDWIKMRDNLWDDPRVAKIVDMTNSSEAAVIGSLYWLWTTADQHTSDGFMPGLTIRSINRKTGVKGFAEAVCSIGWLNDGENGVSIVDFEKHNGASAKKRLLSAKRVAKHASANGKTSNKSPCANASIHQIDQITNAASVSEALKVRYLEEEEEEEKKKDKKITDAGASPPPLVTEIQDPDPPIPNPPTNATMAGAVCIALKSLGMGVVNPGNMALKNLIDSGADIGTFIDVGRECVEKNKPFSYLLAVVKCRMNDSISVAEKAISNSKPSAFSGGF